jgi:hypothetical protein
MWIDSQCHLDLPECEAACGAVIVRATGVLGLVLPARREG